MTRGATQVQALNPVACQHDFPGQGGNANCIHDCRFMTGQLLHQDMHHICHAICSCATGHPVQQRAKTQTPLAYSHSSKMQFSSPLWSWAQCQMLCVSLQTDLPAKGMSASEPACNIICSTFNVNPQHATIHQTSTRPPETYLGCAHTNGSRNSDPVPAYNADVNSVHWLCRRNTAMQ